MIPFVVFNVQVTVYCAVFGLAAAWYLQPRLRALDQSAALAVPLLFSGLRVTGLLFLVPNLNVGMPAEFSWVAGVGDAAVAVLALIAAVANRARSPLGTPLAWAYVVIGGGDLVFGFIQGFRYDIFPHLGGAWGPLIFVASLILVSLATLVVLLIRPNAQASSAQRPAPRVAA